jgi:hypothetical protein
MGSARYGERHQRPQATDAVRKGSMEALHSDGKPERIADVSKLKACVDGAARTGFPGTATK